MELLFFLFHGLTLLFVLHTAKPKKSNFLNDLFLSLTAFARVTSFRILSLAKVLSSLA